MSSTTKTSSLDESCSTGLRELGESYERLRPEPGESVYLHDPMGKTISLEERVDVESWIRASGTTQDGGMAEIDGVERTDDGWLVRIKALDGVEYQVKLDDTFDLIDVKEER